MTGNELVKKIRVLGRFHKIPVKLEHRRGKGSHSTLFYGSNFAIVPNLKHELKKGTHKAILKQLKLSEREFRKLK